ncbi:hypothetical protein PHJA_002107300 [Phtheirospermum japonicum]|uniref:DUF4378 domain-containing protein n=1 Tax=Phtheirospermum japonicum TaxID=374723 RepID=A0A830CN13_9LAMI|nr:hypothetical protein PHJA_002107300 [Phtheirospermum japonicum]
MGNEKQSSKSGNYVGGLLNLFDWNAKSRKKLFSSKSDLPENSKQKKRSVGNLPSTRLHMLNDYEITAGSSMKEYSDYSCTSSLTDDDLYTSKAPNVVARLMGLDSLPKSNFLEPNSTPHSDYQSFTSSHHRSKSLEYFQDFTEPKYQKVTEKPISKFQTEVLPPKLVKSVPIIAPRAQPGEKTKMPLASSSSVPLKVRELKKPLKSNSSAGKNLKGPSTNKSWNGSVGSENKGKSISLALQAKANVQKRALVGQKEMNEVNTSRVCTSQPIAQKSTTLKKPSLQKGTNVLRQNNQKQNCIVDRKKPSPLKPDSQNGKKALNGNSSKLVGPAKVSSSKLTSEVKDDNKRQQVSERVTRKKRSFDGENNRNASNSVTKGKNGKAFDSSSAVTDVVSFTFTSPITRPGSVGPAKNCKIFSADSPSKRMMLDSDGTGDDIFSTFLEQQLKELTLKVQFSQQKTKNGNYYADSRQGQPGSGQKCQGPLGETGLRGNKSADRMLLDCRFPSPVSVLEHFPIAESCNSSDTADSNSTGGGKNCSSIHYSVNTLGEADLSDSASSTSTVVTKTRETALTSSYHKKPTCHELNYVKKLLNNIEPMFNDYATGKSSQIIKPRLFNQLENRKENISRINRRLMFDCVNECLDVRCGQYAKGGYKLWDKGVRTVRRRDKLADDVYKEICGWGAMGHFMVDEIVEDDMSSKNGRWVDYDVEAFELGMLIESRVLSSLIDEVVDDILVL